MEYLALTYHRPKGDINCLHFHPVGVSLGLGLLTYLRLLFQKCHSPYSVILLKCPNLSPFLEGGAAFPTVLLPVALGDQILLGEESRCLGECLMGMGELLSISYLSRRHFLFSPFLLWSAIGLVIGFVIGFVKDQICDRFWIKPIFPFFGKVPRSTQILNPPTNSQHSWRPKYLVVHGGHKVLDRT